jgi:hypothetical protein
MKETVDKLIVLGKQIETLRPELDKAVKEMVVEYEKYDSMRYGSLDYPTKVDSIEEWNVVGESICGRWYNYGGQADGHFQFPAVYLYDTEQFEAFKKICLDTKTAREELEVEKQRLSKIQKIQELQRDLARLQETK